MKRFIDLRGSHADGRFAWFDTVTSWFETHSDSMAWNTWEEFEKDYDGHNLERYRGLAPNWVHTPQAEAMADHDRFEHRQGEI